MDGDEDYVGQLKDVFNDCDSSGAGLLCKEDLVLLCEKLQVEDHADALVARLIGSSDNKRVGFDEFKDGFVAVLSQCTDLWSTEDEVSASANSFYEEANAASPKFVRDGKKYGRRTRPENQGSETPLDFAELSDMEMDYSYTSPVNTPNPDSGSSRKLHTTPVSHDLATVVSPIANQAARALSPTEDSIAEVFEGEGLLNTSIGPTDKSDSGDLVEIEALREIWKKQGVGKDGYLTFEELGAICENMGMDKMTDTELEDLFEKLDADKDGRVSFDEFVQGLTQQNDKSEGHSQRQRSHSSQGRKSKHNSSMSLFDSERRTQTPSILSAITGSGYFSCIDPESSGYAQPEDIIEYWESFGVTHDDVLTVLEALEFDLGTKINLQELSSTLEHELLNHVQDNPLYHVSVYSCRQELRYLKGVLETNSTEKDKLIQEIHAAKARNEIIIKEADDRHQNQEKQHEIKLNGMDQKYTEQIKAMQTQHDKERELLTSNAQMVKQQLETELSKVKEEERRLKQELSYHQTEYGNIEKELHAHLDKNSTLEKDNDRLKRELANVTAMHKKMEEMESQRVHLTHEQHRFSEQRIKDLEDENKALRDHADQLTLEIEEVRMSSSRRSARGEGQRSRSGSLLSDYTQTQAAETNTETPGSDEDIKHSSEAKKPKLEPSHEEELLKLEILKLKDLHAEQVAKQKRIHETEKIDLQDAFRNDMTALEQQNKKLLADMERQLDEERLQRSNLESDWRRKYETEKAQLKLSASRERMELVNKMQEEHREQMKQLRQEINSQCDKEIKLVRDQLTQEKDLMKNRLQKKLDDYDHMLDRGADSLRGKLREDFTRLVEEQAQNEIEVEKRHLEALYQKDRDELYDLLNKEKQSMEDQFNDRLYDLEDQLEDAEENVRAQCEIEREEREQEFMEQIQVVQEAFNEERTDYDKQVANLKAEIRSLEVKLRGAVQQSELDLYRQQRDDAINQRDEIQLEKNRMMLERNSAHKEIDKLKKSSEREKATLQSQINELQKLSSTEAYAHNADKTQAHSSPQPTVSSSIAAVLSTKLESRDENRSLLDENDKLTKQLAEAEEKLFNMTTEYQLSQAQFGRELQDMQLKLAKSSMPESYKNLEDQLRKEMKKNQELEEVLDMKSSQGRRLIIDSEDQHNKVLLSLQFERDEYKTRLLATRKSLTEVTEKLKQQMNKSIKADELVRDLYIENANLVEALYVTEKRQKTAERKEYSLRYQHESLTSAYKKMIPAVLEAANQG